MIPFYISRFKVIDRSWLTEKPWDITAGANAIVREKIKTLSADFFVNGDVAIHKSAIVEENAVLKGPLIISENCFVAAHAYLRDGVFLDECVSVGPGCKAVTIIPCSLSSNRKASENDCTKAFEAAYTA